MTNCEVATNLILELEEVLVLQVVGDVRAGGDEQEVDPVGSPSWLDPATPLAPLVHEPHPLTGKLDVANGLRSPRGCAGHQRFEILVILQEKRWLRSEHQ